MASKKRDFWVTPHQDGWAVKREGATRAGSVHDTKKEAMQVGRERAKRAGVELVEQGKTGQIRDSDSYGRDPNPPRDKNR